MTSKDLGVLEAIYTTGSVRYFRPDPIPQEIVAKLIEAATRAPSGSNQQSWRFLVIMDAAARAQVGALYKEAWDQFSPPSRLAAITDPRDRRRVESAYHLGAHMGDEAPVLVMVCAPREQAASAYPAVQNLLLAARAHGIGGCLTTIHRFREAQIKQVLGIPEDVETYALVPLGYPAKSTFRPVRRKPVGEVSYLDRWGERLPGTPSP